jgi:hypothetical protein
MRPAMASAHRQFAAGYYSRSLPRSVGGPAKMSLAFAIDPVIVVLRRRWIEFPAPAVALFHFFCCVQRFVVFVSQPGSHAQFFNHILVGRGRGPAYGLVADVGASPIGINIAPGKLRRARVMLTKLAPELLASRRQPLRFLKLLLNFFISFVLFALRVARVYEFTLRLVCHKTSPLFLILPFQREKSLAHNQGGQKLRGFF